MLPYERRQAILSVLGSNGSATVRELSERYNVSVVTIRRDLEQLEEDGLIVKTHGGAVALGANTHADLGLNAREQQHQEEKERIGRRAAELVQEGDTVILDEGSTCLAVARFLKTHQGVTVVTNGVRVAAEFLSSPQITLVVIGGVCDQVSAMLYGAETEKAYAGLRADIYFMGIDAFSENDGIMDGNYLQVSLKRTKAEAARRVIGVAHQAKFGRLAFAQIGPLSILDALVTDTPVKEELQRTLTEHDIDCIEA